MKKLILIFFLFFPLIILAQVKGKTKKGKITTVEQQTQDIPKAQKENNPPQIELMFPQITKGQTFKTDLDQIMIKGKVTDESQIKEFFVNNKPLVLSGQSEFSIPQSLPEGANKFQLTAEDIHGNLSIFPFTIEYSRDRQAPQIQLTSPLAANGSTINVTDKKLVVSGTVIDKDGIAYVELNSVKQKLDGKNGFHATMNLVPGSNSFILNTADNNKNVSIYSFTVFFVDDITGPVLSVSQPNLASGSPIVTKDAMMAVIGTASDKSGIKSFMVNGSKAKFIEGGQYFSNVILSPGLNTIKIEATDSLENRSVLTFTATLVTDTKPPVVILTDPPATRGLKPVSKNEVITLKGNASDESGISSVNINNRPALVDEFGNFSLVVNLTVGDNQFLVTASDNQGNASLDTFTITRKLDELITAGKYYALIIGIDEYSGAWTRLRNAVNDAKGVETILRNDYQFDHIITLYNKQASRSNIISEIEKLMNAVGNNDNVLIFYSGHGELNTKLNKGFWVPADATTNSTAGYISNNDLQTYIGGMNSRHTLLVTDACFAADIFRGRTSELEFENTEKYFKEVYRRASRYGLTSGGVEPVTDGGKDGHSVFTYYFLKKLKENTSRYFTAGQLFNEIQIPVTNNSVQSPIYQPIKDTGDEGGQFIFIKK